MFGQGFQKAYPDIKVTTLSAGRGSVRIQRIMAERRARIYNVDIYIGSPTDVTKTLITAKAVPPLKPLLALPEVVDRYHWSQHKDYYIDKQSKYTLMYEGTPQGGGIVYNTKLVDPKELKSFFDLLNPKWKGKIISIDPLVDGSSQQNLSFFYNYPPLGPNFIRRLYGEMDIPISRDDRQVLDWLAIGKYSFALFTRGTEDAIDQGLPIAMIPPGLFKEGAFVSPRSGLVSYMNQAPHPNAAKVAVNWLLSRQGQTVFQDLHRGWNNSMRENISKDKGLPIYRRQKGVDYMMANPAEYIDLTPIRQLLKERP